MLWSVGQRVDNLSAWPMSIQAPCSFGSGGHSVYGKPEVGSLWRGAAACTSPTISEVISGPMLPCSHGTLSRGNQDTFHTLLVHGSKVTWKVSKNARIFQQGGTSSADKTLQKSNLGTNPQRGKNPKDANSNSVSSIYLPQLV